MTIEEISEAKREAESKIVDILNSLEITTSCHTNSVTIDYVKDDTFGMASKFVKKTVTINLLVP